MSTGLPAAKNADFSTSARSAGSLSAAAPLTGQPGQAPMQPCLLPAGPELGAVRAGPAPLPTPTDWATKEAGGGNHRAKNGNTHQREHTDLRGLACD